METPLEAAPALMAIGRRAPLFSPEEKTGFVLLGLAAFCFMTAWHLAGRPHPQTRSS